MKSSGEVAYFDGFATSSSTAEVRQHLAAGARSRFGRNKWRSRFGVPTLYRDLISEDT